METVEYDIFNHWSTLANPEINFTWAIDNFSAWIATVKQQKEWVAYSPLFPSEPCPTNWKLMFRIEKGSNGEEKISLYICPVIGQKDLEVHFFFLLRNNVYVPYIGSERLHFTPRDKFLGDECFFDLQKLIKQVELRGNKVTFVVYLTIYEEIKITDSYDKVQRMHLANAKLNADMEKLLGMDKYGDVEFVVGGRTFSAYKGILAARSTVFADMFQSKKNRFKLDNIEPEVFQEVLRYIYTDQVADLGAMMFQLFAAAHRYNIVSLKHLCREAILAKDLTLDTFADGLIAGSIYDAPAVKRHALCFFANRPVGFTQTRGWKELVKAHPSLADEAIELLARLANDLNSNID